MDLGSLGRSCVSFARLLNRPNPRRLTLKSLREAGTNGPTLGTIAEKSAHKGVRGQKRRHGVTALRALDLRVAPE